jgi:hypothetical protein
LPRWRGRTGEQLAHFAERLASAGAVEAVVADFTEAFGQHMLQEATDEFFGVQCAGLALSAPAVRVTESYLIVFQL